MPTLSYVCVYVNVYMYTYALIYLYSYSDIVMLRSGLISFYVQLLIKEEYNAFVNVVLFILSIYYFTENKGDNHIFITLQHVLVIKQYG